MQKLGLERVVEFPAKPVADPAFWTACVEGGSRLLASSFFLFLAMLKMRDLPAWIARREGDHTWTFYATLGSRISILLFYLLMVTLFAAQSRPRKKATGNVTRVSPNELTLVTVN